MTRCTSCCKYLPDPGPEARYCEFCGQIRVSACTCLVRNTPEDVARSSIIHGQDSLCGRCGRVFLYSDRVGGDPRSFGLDPIPEDRVDLYPSVTDPEAHRAWLAKHPALRDPVVPAHLEIGPRASNPVSRHGRLYSVRANGDLDCWELPREPGGEWRQPSTWTRVGTSLVYPFPLLQVSEGFVYHCDTAGNLVGHALGVGSNGECLRGDLRHFRDPRSLLYRNHLLACGFHGADWVVGHSSVGVLADSTHGPQRPEELHRIANIRSLQDPPTCQIKAGGGFFFVRTPSHSLLSFGIQNGILQRPLELDRNPNQVNVRDWVVRGRDALVLKDGHRPVVQVFGGDGASGRRCVLADQEGNDLTVRDGVYGSSALALVDQSLLVLTSELRLVEYGLVSLRAADRDDRVFTAVRTWNFGHAWNQQARPCGLHVLTWQGSAYVILHIRTDGGDRLLGLRLDQAEADARLFENQGVQFARDYQLALGSCGPLLLCFARSAGQGVLKTVDVREVLG